MRSEAPEKRAGFRGSTVLAAVVVALAVSTPLGLGKGKDTIQVKAVVYRVETTKLPPMAPGQVVTGPLGPDAVLTDAVNRERSRTDIYQTVEANGMVYTLTCVRCNALASGTLFEAEIQGTVMWIKRPKDASSGKTVKVRYSIVDARPKE